MRIFMVVGVVCAIFAVSKVNSSTYFIHPIPIDLNAPVFFSSIIPSLQALTPEQRKKIENQLIADCGKKEEVSEADVAAIMDRQLPSTRAGKCMHACMLETLGLVHSFQFNWDNKFERHLFIILSLLWTSFRFEMIRCIWRLSSKSPKWPSEKTNRNWRWLVILLPSAAVSVMPIDASLLIS